MKDGDCPDFAAAANYCLWGRLRLPKNVDPNSAASPAKFSLIEHGLHRFMASLPRSEADSAETMIMVEGAGLQAPAVGIVRAVAILSGTCYSPQVCDFAMCEFSETSGGGAEALTLPFCVRLRNRPNRVSDRFTTIDFVTSSEFALHLEGSFGDMRLFKLDHEVALDVDGSLVWSRVTGATDMGILWAEGQKKPWGAQQTDALGRATLKQKRLMSSLLATNPFDDTAEPPRRSVRRRVAHNTPRASAPRPSPTSQGASSASNAIAHAESGQQGGDVAGRPFAEASDIMDLAEGELEDLAADELLELEAIYGDSAGDGVGNAIGKEDVEECAEEPVAAQAPDRETEQAIIAEIVAVSEAVGLEGEDGDDVVGGHASASGGDAGSAPAADAEPSAPPPPPQDAPWASMEGPSASGYVYLDGRSAMRIQRGKPAGRLTLSCYRHPSCNLIINLDRAPDDDELKRWFFEVEPVPPGASKEEKLELKNRHVKSARARWTSRLSR